MAAQKKLEQGSKYEHFDVDGDGVVDEGELDRRETGGKASDFRASYNGYTRTSYDSFFTATRGMKH